MNHCKHPILSLYIPDKLNISLTLRNRPCLLAKTLQVLHGYYVCIAEKTEKDKYNSNNFRNRMEVMNSLCIQVVHHLEEAKVN